MSAGTVKVVYLNVFVELLVIEKLPTIPMSKNSAAISTELTIAFGVTSTSPDIAVVGRDAEQDVRVEPSLLRDRYLSFDAGPCRDAVFVEVATNCILGTTKSLTDIPLREALVDVQLS
jgi:hypothetical protein